MNQQLGEPKQSSFWLENALSCSFDSIKPKSKHQRDIVIIGSGISGIGTAYWIYNEMAKGGNKNCEFYMKHGVYILEQREQVCSGATGRNGGHIWPGLNESFASFIDKYGKESCAKLLQLNFQTLDAVKKISQELNIDCDFFSNGSLIVAETEDLWNDFKLEYEYICQLGLQDEIELWDAASVEKHMKTKQYFGGLFTRRGSQIFPAKFVRSLAKHITQSSDMFDIFVNSKVASVESDSNNHGQYKVYCENGAIIDCSHVIYATNGWTSNLIPNLKEIMKPVRGQVIATKPLSKIVLPHNILCNDGFEYVVQRRTDKRIILGGYRWKALDTNEEIGIANDKELNQQVSNALHQFFSNQFIDIFDKLNQMEIEYEWTGIMCFTEDMLPIVDRLPINENQYILGGYTGHGMPIAFMCGKAIAELVLYKKTDVFIDLFSLNRFTKKN